MNDFALLRKLSHRFRFGACSGALFGALALISACQSSTPTSATSPAASANKETSNMHLYMTQIQRAETTWAESLKSCDTQQLATLIAPSFTFIGPDGQVEDRKAYLAGYEQLPQLGLKVESIDMSEVDVRFFGDMAVVTGRVVAKLKMKDEPLTENVRFTRVYQRNQNGWLMVSGQGTRLAAAGS